MYSLYLIFQTAIQCCAPFGVVIDTAHLVTRENFVLGMKALWTQSYLTIDFSSVLTMDNDMELRVSRLCMKLFLLTSGIFAQSCTYPGNEMLVTLGITDFVSE